MSTDYILFEDKHGSLELSEYSMKFDLDIYNDNYVNASINDLTLQQLKVINEELTKIISYFE